MRTLTTLVATVVVAMSGLVAPAKAEQDSVARLIEYKLEVDCRRVTNIRRNDDGSIVARCEGGAKYVITYDDGGPKVVACSLFRPC
jgi:hypothetical protein